MVVRLAAGEGIRAAGGRSEATAGVIALIASLGAQATLTALDTPDTRSWETLPARIAVVRMKVKPGAHRVHLAVSGATRDATLIVPGDGYAAASLFAPW